MSYKTSCLALLFTGLFLISCAGTRARAATPEIDIDLRFEKEKVAFDEPIAAKVRAHNQGKTLFVAKGFKNAAYQLEMKIVNPAGRLLVARPYETKAEVPDAPPLPFEYFKNRFYRVADAEELPAGWKRIETIKDLRQYYDLSVPGRYSAQVQLSLMIFKGNKKEYPSDIKSYRWLGVLKSTTRHFYINAASPKKDEVKKQAHQSYLNGKTRKIDSNSMRIVSSGNVERQLNGKPKIASLSADFQNVDLKRISSQISSGRFYLLAKGSAKKVPVAELIVPAQAADIDSNTEIRVEVINVGKNTVVIMKVRGREVYNNLYPDPENSFPFTHKIPIGQSSFFLSYRHWEDPALHIQSCQQVDVKVTAYNKKKPDDLYTYNFSFRTSLPDLLDADKDCILDTTEAKIPGFNTDRKTLFVRPLKETAPDTYTYWSDFKTTLFPDPRPGFAYIKKLDDAGIEICVIGDRNHPYPPMRDEFYNPGTDNSADRPACDILEVKYMAITDACPANVNAGHTYFSGSKWSWDTKGLTPNITGTAHYQKYHYHVAYVYGVPLDNYMQEGAYDTIDTGLPPVTLPTDGTNLYCTSAACTAKPSPLNLNDQETTPPFRLTPDATVEFNEITFASDARVSSIGNTGTKFDRDAVLARTTLHEMGHALLSAYNSDHCFNPNCIMYSSVEDWTLNGFGDVDTCTHSAGGSKDIRESGVIHNSVH